MVIKFIVLVLGDIGEGDTDDGDFGDGAVVVDIGPVQGNWYRISFDKEAALHHPSLLLQVKQLHQLVTPCIYHHHQNLPKLAFILNHHNSVSPQSAATPGT